HPKPVATVHPPRPRSAVWSRSGPLLRSRPIVYRAGARANNAAIQRDRARPAAKGLQVIKLLKRVLAMAFIAALAGVIIYASTLPSVQKQFTGRRGKTLGDGPVPVAATRAKIGDVPIYLDGVGTAKARNTVTVRPQVDGRILSINFKEGQDVKRGDLLARID